MTLLTRLTNEMVQFVPETEGWEDAIRTASKPLLKKRWVGREYVDKMVQNVKEFGPYIVLMPGVAMPHARPEDGVNQMGISLMVTEKQVEFEEGKTANLFFVLAATDDSSHLTILQEISELLMDEQKVEQLMSATNYEQFLTLFKEGE